MYYLGSFWCQIHGILFGQKLNLVNGLENYKISTQSLNPLNAELNPICHLLALLGAHPRLHVSRIRVKHA
jgi:hypothetical protein